MGGGDVRYPGEAEAEKREIYPQNSFHEIAEICKSQDVYKRQLLAELVRARVALIAMHTNFDNAEDGVNQALCDKLGIRESETLESGMHIGNIDPVPLADFRKHVEKALGGDVYKRQGKRPLPRPPARR